jgi:hypothetical protein
MTDSDNTHGNFYIGLKKKRKRRSIWFRNLCSKNDDINTFWIVIHLTLTGIAANSQKYGRVLFMSVRYIWGRMIVLSPTGKGTCTVRKMNKNSVITVKTNGIKWLLLFNTLQEWMDFFVDIFYDEWCCKKKIILKISV